MKVSSPIGELPFEPRRITVSRTGVHIEGAMGAWPAHVHVEASDLPALARLLPLRTVALSIVGLLVTLSFRSRSNRALHRRRSRHV
jgi:hypothetical protein